MRAISQRIQGELIEHNGKRILILHDAKPDKEVPGLLYLRYALVRRGPEAHVFPALLLDDWGAEIKGLKLYTWFKEHAEAFPRAELFGFEANGNQTQAFLREIEIYFKFPCYAYQSRSDTVETGQELDAVLLRDPAVSEPKQVKRPTTHNISYPLHHAAVQWWQLPPAHRSLQFL